VPRMRRTRQTESRGCQLERHSRTDRRSTLRAARALIADGRFADAYADYQKMLERFLRNTDALTDYGLLAAH
jgi:hypothetical protein